MRRMEFLEATHKDDCDDFIRSLQVRTFYFALWVSWLVATTYLPVALGSTESCDCARLRVDVKYALLVGLATIAAFLVIIAVYYCRRLTMKSYRELSKCVERL